MTDREAYKKISQVILSNIKSSLTIGGSKLATLQEIYANRKLGFKQKISEPGKVLTKKIFGTSVRCIRVIQQQQLFSNCPNLTALSFLILKISFQDAYVMKILIDKLNEQEAFFDIFSKTDNPYLQQGISCSELHKIFAQILLKINSLRMMFSIDDILKDYFVGAQTFSVFLRMILFKLNFEGAGIYWHKITNTTEMFSILCEFFDLNVIARKSNSILQKNGFYLKPEELKLGQKSQIFLFNDYNLFISTSDNEQFCCGRYYSNETELLNSQREIRKSTFDYFLKCKQTEQKNVNEDLSKQQKQQQKMVIRMSQVEMDLGMSNSSFMLNLNMSETPYFSSNAGTPEFGDLMDSQRFKKSLDFSNAIKRIDEEGDGRRESLIIVEEDFNDANSPISEVVDQRLKGSGKKQKNQTKGLFEAFDEIAKIKISHDFDFRKKSLMKSSDDLDMQNIPRSPPTISNQQKNNQNQIIKVPQIKRSTNPFIQICKQNGQKVDSVLQNLSIIKRKNSERSISLVSQEIQEINIQSDKFLSIPFQKKVVKDSSEEKSSKSRRRENSQRKLSFNIVSNNKQDASQKPKTSVHITKNNFYKKDDFDCESIMNKSEKSDKILKKNNRIQNRWNNEDQIFENNSESQSKSKKKMQFSSNIISIQVGNIENEVNKNKMIIREKADLRMAALKNAKGIKSYSKSPKFFNKMETQPEHLSMLASRQISQIQNMGYSGKKSAMGRFGQSSRIVKTSKCPEFLKNSKSRKFNKNSQVNLYHFQQNNKREGKFESNKSLKIEKKNMTKSRRITEYSPKDIPKVSLPKVEEQSKQNSTSSPTQESSKKIKQQKKSNLLQNLSDPNLCLHDLSHRPWANNNLQKSVSVSPDKSPKKKSENHYKASIKQKPQTQSEIVNQPFQNKQPFIFTQSQSNKFSQPQINSYSYKPHIISPQYKHPQYPIPNMSYPPQLLNQNTIQIPNFQHPILHHAPFIKTSSMRYEQRIPTTASSTVFSKGETLSSQIDNELLCRGEYRFNCAPNFT